MRARSMFAMSLVVACSLPASIVCAQPTTIPTTPLRGTCRGDGALHAAQTPAETAVDAALSADLRERHLGGTAPGRACTHAEQPDETTTWSLVEWTEGASHHATQSVLAIVACVAEVCSVASTNSFVRWARGSAPLTRAIDGFDVFTADASYAVVRLTTRSRAGAGSEDESRIAVYYLDAGHVLGFDLTNAVRVYDHYELAVDVRSDATVGATLVHGEGSQVERRLALLAGRPTVRTLSAGGSPIAHP